MSKKIFITDPNWQINTNYIDTNCPIFWHLCLYTIRYINIVCFPLHWYWLWFTQALIYHYQHQHYTLFCILNILDSPQFFLTLNQCIYNVISPIISKYIFLTPGCCTRSYHPLAPLSGFLHLSHHSGWKWKKSLAGKVYDFYEVYEVSWVKFPLRLCLTPSCPEYNVISLLIGPNIGPDRVGIMVIETLAGL